MTQPTCGIYKITNTITNEVYIGKSKNIEGRFEGHKNSLNYGTHHNKGLQKDYNLTEAIFPDFKIYDYEIIKEVKDHELEGEEEKFIEEYNSFKKGYNRTKGGQYDVHKGLEEWGGDRLLDPRERINLIEKELVKYVNSIDVDSMNKSEKDDFVIKLLKKTETLPDPYFFENLYAFYFDKVIEIEPNNKDIWYYKTEFLLKFGEYEEALKAINKSIELNPENEKNWYLKAESLNRLRRSEEALKYNAKAIEIEPYNDAVWIQKAECFERLEDYEEAIKIYDKAIKQNPSHYKNWERKIYALKRLGKYEEAIECLEELLKIDSYRSIGYKRLIGECLEKQGKYKKAMKFYDKAYKEEDFIVFKELKEKCLEKIEKGC